MRAAYQVQWQGQKRHGKSIIAARMSLTPKTMFGGLRNTKLDAIRRRLLLAEKER